MKLGDVFKRLAKVEHIDEESFNNLRMYAKIKTCFEQLAEKMLALRPSKCFMVSRKVRGVLVPSFSDERQSDLQVT